MPEISPLAGKPAPASILVDVSELLDAYYRQRPRAEVRAQRVAFGTSGHRGSSLDAAFNEAACAGNERDLSGAEDHAIDDIGL